MARQVDLQEILETLLIVGLSEKDYYLVGNPTSGGELIEFWHPEIGPRVRLMDDQDLANACKEYLQAMGVRRFKSSDDLWEAVKAEKWPNWEKYYIPRERMMRRHSGT